MLLIITSTCDVLFSGVNIDDLEPQNRFLVICFATFGCRRVNPDKMDKIDQD